MVMPIILTVSLCMISLCLAYQVLATAYQSKGDLRVLGQVIGTIVILATVALVVLGASQCRYMKTAGSKPMCSMPGKVCPVK